MRDSLSYEDYINLYRRLGISIIPVGRDKKPLVKWEEYQRRQPTEEEVKSFFDARPNVAVVCGRVSGNLAILDFEKEEDFWAFFKPEILSSTLVVRTPHGGIHVWLRSAGEVPKRSIKISEEHPLDILGEGGYALAPPSIVDHSRCDKSKCKREGLGGYELISTTYDVLEVKDAYQAVLHRARELGWKLKEKLRVEEIISGVPEGMRNVSAFQYARYLLFKAKLDPHTVWYELRRWNTLNNPPLDEKELRTVWQSAQKYPYAKPESEPIILEHLNMVEDPELAGKSLTVDAVVSSTSIAYLVPKEVEARMQRGDGDEVLDKTFEADDPFNLKLVGVNEDIKYRRLKRLFDESGRVKVEEKTWRTVYLVRVRPPVFALEKKSGILIDERGFEYKPFDVYVVAEQQVTFQPSSLVRLRVKPLPSPRSQKTVLLASDVEFPEEVLCFDEVKLRRLKTKLDSYGSVKEKVNWILSEFQKYSGIVGRKNLAFAGFLTYFSPVWVSLNGEVQRGWLLTIFIGDSTTGKSETVRKLIMLLKGGMLVTAETASQVGLTGTATQLEREGWFVDWGFLVLCDRKLLAIDGVHRLPLSCWAALAEAERSGVVTITKAAKESAYARTRQIKIANAVDGEAGKFTTKPLADFLYPCQALATVLDKTGIARLDLAVFADSRDVKVEEVNIRMNEKPDPDLELLSEVLKWCWSGKAKIKFTGEAVNEILKSATELYHSFYCYSIPLVGIDMKWKLARLSASLAILTLSTEDFSEVIVRGEHVREIVEFLKEEYMKAGLNSLAQEERHETYTTEDAEKILDNVAVYARIGRPQIEEILKFIVLQGRVTTQQLKTQFSLAEKSQLRPFIAFLENEGLIKRGNGFYPTARLIQLYKVLTLPGLPGLPGVEKEGVNSSYELPYHQNFQGGSLSRVGNPGNPGKASAATTSDGSEREQPSQAEMGQKNERKEEDLAQSKEEAAAMDEGPSHARVCYGCGGEAEELYEVYLYGVGLRRLCRVCANEAIA